jgi:23S rRNA pseudouridine1911/1915/1917 synthase
MPQTLRFTVELVDQSKRLDKFLAGKMPDSSRTTIQKAIKEKNVLVNGKEAKSSYKTRAGDVIEIKPSTGKIDSGSYPLTNFEVIYEDKNLLAVNKPAGVLVCGKRREGEVQTLVEWLRVNRPEVNEVGDDQKHRPGIVHRLDKDTSGIVLVAKNQESFDYLKNLFQTHKIKKTYLALALGRVKEEGGMIDKPIGLKSGTIRRTVFVRNAKMVKPAQTEYKVKERLVLQIGESGQEYTLLNVLPKTGRTHQIRVHLKSIGHPITGDVIYGSKKDPLTVKRQFLHAESLELMSIKGKKISLSVGLPDDLKEVLERLVPADNN